MHPQETKIASTVAFLMLPDWMRRPLLGKKAPNDLVDRRRLRLATRLGAQMVD